MKRLRNEFFKHLHYLCLAGVIALGLMTIVATTGDNGVVAPGGPAAHPSGTLDTTFGGGTGFVVFDGGNGGDSGNSIMPGSILVAGFITNAALDTDMAVWDFNTDGTLNANFGNNGIFVHDDAAGGNNPGFNFDLGTSMTTAANNRILVTGSSTNAAGDTDQVTWRLE